MATRRGRFSIGRTKQNLSVSMARTTWWMSSRPIASARAYSHRAMNTLRTDCRHVASILASLPDQTSRPWIR